MLYENVSGGGSSFPGPGGRSKLSLAVAQASARLGKASLSSGGPPSSMNIVKENAANHQGNVVKSAPQDASSTSVKQRGGAHKKKVTQTSISVSGPQSSQRDSSKHITNMLRRKVTSFTEPSMTHHDQPPAAYNQTSIGRQSVRHNMVERKSHQRLILEQIAAKYFLNNNEKLSRYVGISHVDDDTMCTDNFVTDNVSSVGGVSSTSTPLPLGLADDRDEWRGNKEQKKALAQFLDISRDDTDISAADNTGDNESSAQEESPSASSSAGLESQSSGERDTEPNRKTSTAGIDEESKETNIGILLEIASNHLSMGKNDLALQIYRRAMTRAFADVMSVKNRLREIKRRQAELILAQKEEKKNADLCGAESSALILSRKEESEFELSLLRVASRVADIHNNMGVVHELNRSYKKAHASYRDALDVYHNTCKRVENSDDPDVDRTKSNVKRMKRACLSEEQRNALHDEATRIVKQARTASMGRALTAATIKLNQALKVETEALGSTHPVVANTLIQMGKYYYEMREYDEAVSVIRQAIRNLQNAMGKNHPQVCKALLLLASIYERHGLNVSPEGIEKDEELLEIYVDALDPLKSSLGEVHTEIGLVYTKIGHLYGKKKGNLDLSLLAYKAALKAYGEPTSTTLLGGLHPEVMSVWVCVTEHLHSMGRWDEVTVAGERALFFLRLAKKSLFRDAKLYSNHSNVSLTSEIAGMTSIPIVKTSKKSPIQITSATYYNAVYKTLSSLAQAHLIQKSYHLARGASEESLQLAWEIALSSQHDDRSKGSSHEPLDPATLQLIRALKRLGKVILLQKHHRDALDCFLPCLELLRSSRTTESTLDTASVLGSLGFLYLKLKRFNESSNFLRECLRLYRKNGADANDRETKKIKAWLDMAESREEDFEEPPTILEIPFVI